MVISEVSLIPGRVVHVLQNSPDDPLQLFPSSLLLLQRPLHPLIVLEKKTECDIEGKRDEKRKDKKMYVFIY